MKKLLCLCLLLTVLFPIAHGEEWLSLPDIREQTPARWTQVYETPWRTVVVDVPIDVPAVAAFPILKVRKMPAVDESLLPDSAVVRRNFPGVLELYTDHAEQGLGSNMVYKSIDRYPGPELPEVMAEECTFTPQEALDLAYAQLKSLYGLDESAFRLAETLVFSRIWRYKGTRDFPIYTTAVTQQGSYTIRLRQLLQGIPYEGCWSVYDDLWHGEWLSEARVSFAYRGADGFKLVAQMWQVEEIVHGDMPLLSFDEARAAFEEEILAGRLRTVETVSLCYAPYADAQDADVCWLLPVWYVRGGYADDPQRTFVSFLNPDGSVADDGVERRELVFEAQRGSLLDADASGDQRQQMKGVITWADIEALQ